MTPLIYSTANKAAPAHAGIVGHILDEAGNFLPIRFDGASEHAVSVAMEAWIAKAAEEGRERKERIRVARERQAARKKTAA